MNHEPFMLLHAETILTHIGDELKEEYAASNKVITRKAAAKNFKQREALITVQELLLDRAEQAQKNRL